MTRLDEGVRGGWHLHVLCTQCGARDQYDGFVMTQAADRAETAGWSLDRDQLHAPAEERLALCPLHREDQP